MSLKAILLELNGVIINDETIHQELIAEIIVGENLRPDREEFQTFWLGNSDRLCLKKILACRGRNVSEEYLDKLISKKIEGYKEKFNSLKTVPIYPGLIDFLDRLQEQNIKIGLVTSANRVETELVLAKIGISEYFSVVITGDELATSKPAPDGYLLAIETLDRSYKELNIKPSECLAIENTYSGIEAAKKAGMQVVGVSNTYPLHMLQRRANWTVDYLVDIELDRVDKVLSKV